jgi:diamine N-acetyltransferase
VPSSPCSDAISLTEAHFEPDLPWFRAIYAGEVPVGFLMVEYDSADETYNLWRFMIDAQYQGLGYGRKTLELLFVHIKPQPGADVLYTHCVPAEGGSGPFYEKMGFVYTGEEEGGGLWMRRALEYASKDTSGTPHNQALPLTRSPWRVFVLYRMGWRAW